MSPTTSRGKSGRSYRYYVSARLQQGLGPGVPGMVQRVSAIQIERLVAEAVGRWVQRMDDPFAIVRAVRLTDGGLQLTLQTPYSASLAVRLANGELILDRSSDSVTVLLPIIFRSRGGRHHLVPAQIRPPQPDRVLIAELRRAHAMLGTGRGLPIMKAAPTSPYDRAILRFAFLAPDIQQAILEERQPHRLNLEVFKAVELPLSWSRQREVLGFRH